MLRSDSPDVNGGAGPPDDCERLAFSEDFYEAVTTAYPDVERLRAEHLPRLLALLPGWPWPATDRRAELLADALAGWFIASVRDADGYSKLPERIDPNCAKSRHKWGEVLRCAFARRAALVYRCEIPPGARGEKDKPIVAGLVRRGETAVIGGAEKSAKTLLAIDLAAAVVTGCTFLGRAVAKPAAVWVLSVETPADLWRERFARAVEARGLDPKPALEQLTVTSDLRHIRTRGGRADLARFVELAGVAVAIVDPLYLALEAVSSSDLVGQGQALRRLVRKITAAGAAPVLVSHLLRSAPEGVPPSLRDLQGCAVSAFVRSWLLVSRCGAYAGDGIHRLAALAGTSAGDHEVMNIHFDEWNWNATLAATPSLAGRGRRSAFGKRGA